MKYSVYGLIESRSNKVVYIDIYKYKEEMFPYLTNRKYIDYSIKELIKKKNQYCRDLDNMNKLYSIYVINFEYCDNEEDAKSIRNNMIIQFRPRYNIDKKRISKDDLI